MSKISVARPYAKAISLTAKSDQDLEKWSLELHFLAQISEQPEMKALLTQHTLSAEKLAELYLAIGGERLSAKAKNLVKLLAERKRLICFPEIASLFKELRDERENRIFVHVKSAIPLEEKEKKQIADYFQKALSRQVVLQNEIDKTLLGGFIARSGNYVLNTSLLNRLAELKEEMGG